MSGSVLLAHWRMLPRLEAEESIRRATEVAVGSGTIDAGASRTIREGWAEDAHGRERAPMTQQERLARAELLGIRVVTEPA